MKRSTVGILGLIVSLTSVPVSAGTLDQTLGMDRQIKAEQVMLKDPMIAGLMSASVPGLGQIYSGQKGRGLLFFVGTVGALAGTAAFAAPADLDLIDYDSVQYGGNADGVMSLAELQNWEDGEFEDDAFGDLSTGRKIGAITTSATGLGLYIWNIIDARSLSRAHNTKVIQRRIDLGMTASETQTGLALNLHF
jgi:TM2 domain-containing membrane protein YozV